MPVDDIPQVPDPSDAAGPPSECTTASPRSTWTGRSPRDGAVPARWAGGDRGRRVWAEALRSTLIDDQLDGTLEPAPGRRRAGVRARGAAVVDLAALTRSPVAANGAGMSTVPARAAPRTCVLSRLCVIFGVRSVAVLSWTPARDGAAHRLLREAGSPRHAADGERGSDDRGAAAELGPADFPVPDEARTKDAAGAEAFLRYYIDLLNRQRPLLDGQPLRDLGPECHECLASRRTSMRQPPPDTTTKAASSLSMTSSSRNLNGDAGVHRLRRPSGGGVDWSSSPATSSIPGWPSEPNLGSGITLVVVRRQTSWLVEGMNIG